MYQKEPQVLRKKRQMKLEWFVLYISWSVI